MCRRFPHFLSAILPLIVAAGSPAGDDLRAGAAKVDITPPTGFPMWGYAARHDAPSVGVLDPLHARALVLAAGKTKIALVGLDLGRAPTRDSTAAIRKRVAALGVTEVFLVASHTHHGPVLELGDWPNKEKPYVRVLEDKLADVIIEANTRLKPARVGVGSKEVALNRNRHSKRADAVADRELLVLRVEDADGKPIAHAVNFAAHPTMHDAKLHKFSADYPGALCAAVEKETDAPCLFLQGAAGDLAPNPPATADSADAFGRLLGDEVKKLSRSKRGVNVAGASLHAGREEFRFRSQVDLDSALMRAALGRAFFPEFIDFYRREYRDGVRPTLSVAVLNDSIGFVGVSGEFFCGHALGLKRRARLEHLFFLGYCNDYQQYFPTIEAVSETGYGTLPPIATAEVGAGEQMTDRALIHLYRMRGLVAPEPPAKR